MIAIDYKNYIDFLCFIEFSLKKKTSNAKYINQFDNMNVFLECVMMISSSIVDDRWDIIEFMINPEFFWK